MVLKSAASRFTLNAADAPPPLEIHLCSVQKRNCSLDVQGTRRRKNVVPAVDLASCLTQVPENALPAPALYRKSNSGLVPSPGAIKLAGGSISDVGFGQRL